MQKRRLFLNLRLKVLVAAGLRNQRRLDIELEVSFLVVQMLEALCNPEPAIFQIVIL
ncbi:hypothetical protein AXF42_Ash016194 [Apostasia shenzhenica]|uniref:Uncharacterized protein n=1 Tax=Apostasia shenzhenica TaxID=1088818 RepID=A0A2I0AEP9_9ASPA|nr:hypothetical protein AXF42_Ash016194 [Apostasia shenzhenica]